MVAAFQRGRSRVVFPDLTMQRLFLILLLIFARQLQAADPSDSPVRDSDKEGGYDERWRVIADLDGDGHSDMLLSEPLSTFGKMGGAWGVYLWRKGDFQWVGSVTAHPLAIAFERDRDRFQRDEKDLFYVRIWTYLRDSGSEGGLCYYRVGPHSVQRAEGLTIYPGDGGSDLGRAIYSAVMQHSDIPFRLERSQTDNKGNLTWKKQKP